MSFLDRFRKKIDASQSLDRDLSNQLVNLVMHHLRDKDGRIHSEDAISAAATIVAERCIDAAGDFPLRDHQMTPGARVFSDAANRLICGDVTDAAPNNFPADCIIGMLRALLSEQVYPDAQFPPIEELIKGFVTRIGKQEDWGKVPLSIPAEHFPFTLPLQMGYESRDYVDQILKPVETDKKRCLKIAVMSLADLLTQVEATIDHKIAVTLAIETINGMVKTAPMTHKAMEQVRQRAPKNA